MTVDLDATLHRSTDILYAPSGADSAVMMSIEAGKYYGLNAVAARIWELLEQPRRLSDVVATLESEFEVEPHVCEDAVRKFATEMVEQGIAHVGPA